MWTDTEVMEQFNKRGKVIQGELMIQLPDLEEIIFDSRFPSDKHSKAVELLKAIHSQLKK